MKSFMNWILSPQNLNANIFTMLTVMLSGIISLVISAAYFYKGNRNNLKSSLLHPIKTILEEPYSWKNYKELIEISKDYSARYLSHREREKINELLLAYKNRCTYNYEYVCAESLRSYFNYTLERNGIDTKPVPIYIDDELVDLDFPPDILNMSDDLCREIKKYPPDYDEDNCINGVISTFNAYCKQCYTDKTIKFFEDFSFEDVLKKAHARKEWNEKIAAMEKAKLDFLKLKIAE